MNFAKQNSKHIVTLKDIRGLIILISSVIHLSDFSQFASIVFNFSSHPWTSKKKHTSCLRRWKIHIVSEDSQLAGHINDTLGIFFSSRPSWWSFKTSLFRSFIPPPALSCREKSWEAMVLFWMMSAPDKPSPVSGCSYSSHSCRSKVNNCSSITDNIMYTNILVRTNEHFYSRLKISG